MSDQHYQEPRYRPHYFDVAGDVYAVAKMIEEIKLNEVQKSTDLTAVQKELDSDKIQSALAKCRLYQRPILTQQPRFPTTERCDTMKGLLDAIDALEAGPSDDKHPKPKKPRTGP